MRVLVMSQDELTGMMRLCLFPSQRQRCELLGREGQWKFSYIITRRWDWLLGPLCQWLELECWSWKVSLNLQHRQHYQGHHCVLGRKMLPTQALPMLLHSCCCQKSSRNPWDISSTRDMVQQNKISLNKFPWACGTSSSQISRGGLKTTIHL